MALGKIEPSMGNLGWKPDDLRRRKTRSPAFTFSERHHVTPISSFNHTDFVSIRNTESCFDRKSLASYFRTRYCFNRDNVFLDYPLFEPDFSLAGVAF